MLSFGLTIHQDEPHDQLQMKYCSGYAFALLRPERESLPVALIS